MNKILVFSMEGCAPCKSLKQNINTAGVDTNITVYDVDEVPELVRQYTIRSVPTTIVLNDVGEVMTRISGNIQPEKLRELVNNQ